MLGIDTLRLKVRVSLMLRDLEYKGDVTISIKHLNYVPNFKAAYDWNENTITISPKLIGCTPMFLCNVVTHELGHALSNHGIVFPRRVDGSIDTIRMEKEANEKALPLFSKLYNPEFFYYNHLDKVRMAASEAHYNKAV